MALWLGCYADDPKEPELIGETKVDLTEVLTKGETDGESQSSYTGRRNSEDCRMVSVELQG